MSVAAAIERELTILNQRGLHARAAAKLRERAVRNSARVGTGRMDHSEESSS